MAKHARTVKDLWVSSCRMRPPAIADSLHKVFVDFMDEALLSAFGPSEALQRKIDSARAGAPSAKEPTRVVYDLSPYIARMTKETKRLERKAKGIGCLPVVLAVIIAAMLVGVWLH